jgi:hypothetical protein
LKSLGLFDIVLPIILVYAITFGILERAKIFTIKKDGEDVPRKELNAAIALIIALMFITAVNLLDIIDKFLPFVGLISVLALCFLMLVGLVTGDLQAIFSDETLGRPLKLALIVATAIAFIFTFGIAAGWWDLSIARGIMFTGSGLFSPESLSVILFGLIIIGLIAWISSSGK